MTAHPRLRVALDWAIVLGSLTTIPLTVLQEQGVRSHTLDTMDWAVWSVFALEFLFILFLARDQIRRPATITAHQMPSPYPQGRMDLESREAGRNVRLQVFGDRTHLILDCTSSVVALHCQ